MLYPLEGFIVLQGHPGEMHRDSGPEGQKEHGKFHQRELTNHQRGQMQGCAHLLGWEAAGKAKDSTLGHSGSRIHQTWGQVPCYL